MVPYVDEVVAVTVMVVPCGECGACGCYTWFRYCV